MKFYSPIAIKSAVEAAKDPGSIKGTGRRKTEYRRPPIVKLIGMVGSIKALGRLRGALATGALHGVITPSEKVERRWEQAFWKQVIVIMLKSKNPTAVYNETLTWPKPKWAETAIQLAFDVQCKSLP